MIRIAFTGPESSGKSTLAHAMAKQEGGAYIPEYARVYLEEFGPYYDLSALDVMAKGHLDSLEKEKATLQFVDTDFIVFKVWSEYRFSHASSKIHQLISEDWFNLHVLCAPDIPWESDPLRENPNDRDQLFETYVETLERYRKPYLIVEGSHDKRMKKVQQALRQIQINP